MVSARSFAVAFSGNSLASGSTWQSMFDSFVSSSTGYTTISFRTLNAEEF